MQLLVSAGLFAGAVAKRFYFVILPPLLLDPFDPLKVLFSVEYSPPQWIAWAAFGAGLYLASALAYHEIRTRLPVAPDEVGDTIARLRREKFSIGKHQRDTASILHDLAREFARGLSSLYIERVFRERLATKSQKLPLADILAELRLARVVREEHRQPSLADASGISQSFWTGPYTMYYLTDWGARIVARLRDEAN